MQGRARAARAASNLQKTAPNINRSCDVRTQSSYFESLPKVSGPWKKFRCQPMPHQETNKREFKSSELTYEALEVPGQPQVPTLANELDRVLFSPGVQFLKDPRTNVYNFDTRLENIVSIRDFDFSCIPNYVPAGKDNALAQLAAEQNKKYVGSTSSLTPVLTQLHHALSHQRPPVILGLSKHFPALTTTFTQTQRAPSSLFLRHNPSTDTWSVNNSSISSDELILTLLGQAMETMLVTDCESFQNYTKERSHLLDTKQREATNGSTYNYTTCGQFLMRSQLDCWDPRLPGTGMFDLKTRAVCAIRHDVDYAQIHDGSDYQIVKRDGQFESFAREYFELVRSALLKYSLQARIGRMDGIFVAYHNIRRLFGFEYLPLAEIDKVFHTAHLIPRRLQVRGSQAATRSLRLNDTDFESAMADVAPIIADAEFKLSVNALAHIFNTVLDSTPTKGESYNMIVHCTGPGKLVVFVKPMLDKDVKEPAKHEPTQVSESYRLGEDPHSLMHHFIANPKFLPPDVTCYQVSLESFINGTKVPSNQYPALKSADETWNVVTSIKELEGDLVSQIYEKTLTNISEQQLTSRPQTERSKDEDEVREKALAMLPAATKLQEHLRELDQRGRQYQNWDLKRPKLRWRPASKMDCT